MSGATGGGTPAIPRAFAIADLPAASRDLIGAVAVATGAARATETGELAVRNGTT